MAKSQILLGFAHSVYKVGQDLSAVKYHKYHKKPHNPAQPLGILNIIYVPGFEISLIWSSETSKNDSRTSGIPAGLVRRTTAYFWFSHKLHWLDVFQTSEWYIRTSDIYNPHARRTSAFNLKFRSLRSTFAMLLLCIILHWNTLCYNDTQMLCGNLSYGISYEDTMLQ